MMTDPAGAFAPPPAPRALCVIHPSQAATGTCSRCGSYVCATCDVSEDGKCAACRERLGLDRFPFTRQAWEVGGLVSHAWEAFKRNPGELIGLSLAVFLIPWIIGFAAGMISALIGGRVGAIGSVVVQVLMQFLTLAMTLGAIGVYLDAAQGRPLSFKAFTSGAGRLGAGLVQYLAVAGILLVVLAIPGGVLVAGKGFAWVGGVLLALLIVPLVYVFLGFMFMQFELVNDPSCGALDAMRRSWALADGKRLGMLGVAFVAGIVIMAGVLLCGIGFLASYPIGMLTTTSLYLALRNDPNLPLAGGRD